MYIIKNDYLGHELKNPIVILSSDNKIMSKTNHFYYKRNILYYHDKIHGAFVFYDAMTKNYLGYSKDNKKFESYKSTMSIEIIHSIRDMLLSLGLEHNYINLNHLFLQKNKDINKISNNNIVKNIIRIRCNNLRQIIYRTNSIIEKINNSFPNKVTPYNTEEHKLIAEFQKSLKMFKTTDPENKSPIFKHIYTITNNTSVKELPETIELNIINNFVETDILNKLNNVDSYLLFYYIYNMFKLIEYNTQPAIRTNLAYLLVRIIQFNYNNYYIPIELSQIRKFDSLLLIDAPYIDESSRVVGLYQELVNVKEIDEEVVKEKNYDMQEEQTALDIDEYDENDVYEDEDPNEDVVENLSGAND